MSGESPDAPWVWICCIEAGKMEMPMPAATRLIVDDTWGASGTSVGVNPAFRQLAMVASWIVGASLRG